MARLLKFRRRFSGWRSGVVLCAATTGFFFLLNGIFILYAVTKHDFVGGISDLYVGSCSKVSLMDTWLHFAINVASTIILSASNYTMQIISSPTREEVDEAHRRHDWLDIGIPSVRNVRRISWTRIAMWWTLGLSSVPLHLMYDSVVFSSISANEYGFTVVQESFFDPNNTIELQEYSATYPLKANAYLNYMHDMALNGSLTKYSILDCRSAYAVYFATKVGDVLLVTSDTNVSLGLGGNSQNLGPSPANEDPHVSEIPYFWTCGDGYSSDPLKYKDGKVCTPSIAKSPNSSWTVDTYQIEYCMVQQTPESCKLSFSSTIMMSVLVANLSKCAIMVFTLWRLNNPTLVTVGDGVSSFLQRPDSTTVGTCLDSKQDFMKWGKRQTKTGKSWTSKTPIWFESASARRWITWILLSISVIAVGIYLLLSGIHTTGIYDIKALYDIGFGSLNGNSVIQNSFFSTKTSILGPALISNSPQLLLSMLYLLYNGIFSCIVAADEWSRFAHSRKPLRVTSPVGQQRSTYFLSLPYKYSIPLMIASGIIHWLTSQSLFLALVYPAYAYTGNMATGSLVYEDLPPLEFSLGYSCIAILCALILGSLLVLFGILNGFRRFRPGIPVAGSCSAAISAACHPSPKDTSAAFKPVKWGAVEEGAGDSVGHCSFSSLEVTKPIEGKKYE